MSSRRHGSRPRKVIFYGWWIALALGIVTFIGQGSTTSSFGVFVVPIERGQHWARGDITAAYALSYGVWGVCAVFVGPLIDRLGPRALMTAGSILGGACLVATSQINQLWQLYIFWGVGTGLVLPLLLNEVQFTTLVHWFRRYRGRALSIVTGIGGLSLAVYVPLVGLLIEGLGWRLALVGLAVPFLGVVLPLSIGIVRDRPGDLNLSPDGMASDTDSEPVATDASVRSAVLSPRFWPLSIAISLSTMAFGIINVNQVPFLIDRGFAPLFASQIVGVAGAISIVGRFLYPLGISRVGAQRLLALVMGIQSTGIVSLLLARNELELIPYLIFLGSISGSLGSLRAATMAEQFGRRAYGAIASIAAVPTYLSIGLGAVASGWLFDRLGSYSIVFGAAIILAGVGCLLVIGTPRAGSGPSRVVLRR